ncbi:MAG: hypothetical protein ACR2PQ_06970 [Myxococcota bacterium]
MSCDGRRDAILMLSAGLLEDAEAESLRAHLQTGCAACARSAREARELDAAVLLGAPVERAPDSLRPAVLALAEPANVATASGAPFSRLLLAAGLGALLAGSPALFWASRAADRGEIMARAAAERSAVLDVELEALRTEHAALLEEREELDAELGEADDELTTLRQGIDDAQDQIAMLRRDDTQILAMNGTAAQPAARARMFWNWDDYYCYMHVTGIAPATAGGTYAVWLDTTEGGRILAGTLTPERGEAELWVQLPRDIGQALGAQVTLEPAAPGQEPRGVPQLVSVAS